MEHEAWSVMEVVGVGVGVEAVIPSELSYNFLAQPVEDTSLSALGKGVGGPIIGTVSRRRGPSSDR
jgi:hypothetical protein